MTEKQTPSVVVCKVPNGETLDAIEYLADRNAIKTIKFCEPDLGNISTALATEPVSNLQRKLFKRFPLWNALPFNIHHGRSPPYRLNFDYGSI